MKRTYATSAFGVLLAMAAYLSSAGTAHAGGYLDAGVSFGLRGYQANQNICGSACGSAFGSQFTGLPSALPKQTIPTQTPMAPIGPSGWVAGGYPGQGFPGAGYPGMGNGFPGWGGGFPGAGYPGMGNGYPGWGYPGNGYPGWTGGCGSPCGGPCGGGCGGGGNLNLGLGNLGISAGLGLGLGGLANNMIAQVPGGPCGMSCGGGGGMIGGGNIIIDARSPASWEINDTGSIIGAVGGALMNMNSSVYPIAFPRQETSIPQIPTWTDNRSPGFTPRSGLHTSGSAFQPI